MMTITSERLRLSLCWKILSSAILIFALCFIQRDDGQGEEGERTTPSVRIPAVVIALQSHEPSLRVFRGLFEFALVLLCTSISLRVWEGTFDRLTNDDQRSYQELSFNEKLGKNIIGHLLFRPVNLKEGDDAVDSSVTVVHEEGEISDEAQRISLEADIFSENSDNFKPTPSIAVANAAMNVVLLLLLFLLLFTLGSIDVPVITSDIDAATNASSGLQNIMAVLTPAFPLVVFILLMLQASIPWSKRSSFWKVVFMTVEAPRHTVTFRDGIVGDIITSVVRPLQDIAFTFFYIVSGLQGWWSSMYTIGEAAAPIERSWLLHNVVLPACMISPLWMRFMQCLRQCYETRQRWPYLGNAMKYMIAAEVAMFGAFDPAKKKTFFWIASFVAATLYQIFWDVFYDWELFCVKINEEEGEDEYSGIGSYEHHRDQYYSKRKKWFKVSLRKTRLYSRRSLYYVIFSINFLLRFFWMLSFIPYDHLSRSGELVEQFSIGIQHYLMPMIAVAEIVRRTLWGLLRVELQAIKVLEQQKQERLTVVGSREHKDAQKQDIELHTDACDMTLEGMQPMQICTGEENAGFKSYSIGYFKQSMASATELQIISELCIWSTVFMSLGIFAAAHRQ